MLLSKKSIRESLKILLVLAGIILVLIVILGFSVYSLLSFNFIHIRISSIGSVFAFMGLVLLGTGVLGIVGTLLDSLRRHLLKERFQLSVKILQELVLIAVFGVIIHTVDQWIDGIEIGNVLTEILLTLFLYGLIALLGKLGKQIRKQDAEEIARRRL